MILRKLGVLDGLKPEAAKTVNGLNRGLASMCDSRGWNLFKKKYTVDSLFRKCVNKRRTGKDFF